VQVAPNLRTEALDADERRILVLAGSPDRTRDAARAALEAAAVDPAAVTYLGTVEAVPWEQIPPAQASGLLGTTRQAVVVDCHEGCRPNALGRAVGAVDGGGLLLLLTPSLADWPDRCDGFDERLAVPPFTVADVTGYFRTRLVSLLEAHPGIAVVAVTGGEDSPASSAPSATGWTVRSDGLTHPAPRLSREQPAAPADHVFPAAIYERSRTEDQVAAVAALERLRRSDEALVVEADRGRGKSSAAGLAAGALAGDGEDVLVTAPEYRNAAEVFARASEVLGDAAVPVASDEEGVEGALVKPRELAAADGGVRFEAPSAAVQSVRSDPPDALIVDEAAALPVHLLDDLLAAPSVAFATTVHGYEGASRGFSVRFRERLANSDHAVTDVHLAEPIRYGPSDPVEAWAFRALLLDASPPVADLVSDATPDTVTYRQFAAEELVADEHLLREVFGLLVLAHYRTEPDDLARLLDAPNVAVRALTHEGHVVSVALLAREGGLSEPRRADMYEGSRVKGNMIPDMLTSQLRDESAGVPVGQRIMRIATHHAVRSRGLGSRLLEEIGSEYAADADDAGGSGVDWLGAGYGATPELVRFWRSNGYGTVHLSTTRNDASGEYSAVMLRPTSAAGRELAGRHARWFCHRVPGALSDPLDDADPDVVREVLRSVQAPETDREHGFDLHLSHREWQLLAGLPHGPSIFETAPRPLRRLTMRYLLDTGPEEAALPARQERLLVCKALQGRSWEAVSATLGYASTADCMRALGEAVRPLLSQYGSAFIQDELERFE
jgi:tRNA(Met) cytidine acetyltransferase